MERVAQEFRRLNRFLVRRGSRLPNLEPYFLLSALYRHVPQHIVQKPSALLIIAIIMKSRRS